MTDEKSREDDRVGNGHVQVFRLRGPAWRPRLHPGSKLIGIPDINSHRPKQAEDDISENAVKNGFSIPMVVGNETFSAHDMIFDRLKATSLLSQLGSLFQEVLLRKDDLTNHRSSAGPQQFRTPQRVTLNEIKLAAYIKELADPETPLKKLAKSVPHGYRGERMLDMLWNGGNLTPAMAAIKAQVSTPGNTTSSQTMPRSVKIERAVWFIRVVGCSGLSSSRARQGQASSYTIEWTSVFMGWLRRQIVELNIVQNNVGTPTTPASPKAARILAQVRGGMTSQSDSHYCLLLDDDFRQRWYSKWQYSLRLFRSLCHHNLIDLATSVKVTLDMLRTANIAQVTFLLALTEELLESIFGNATLVHQAIDVLCAKMMEFSNPTNDADCFQQSVRQEVQAMLTIIINGNPEALVNPNRWRRHNVMLREIMIKSELSKRQVECLSKRNEKLNLCLLNEPENEQAFFEDSDYHRKDISILDRIALEISVDEAFTHLFQPSKYSVGDKLKTVLIWSTSQFRKGYYRPYAGAYLLYLYSQGKVSRLGHRGKNGTASLHKIDLGTFLLKWISEVETVLQQHTDEHDEAKPSKGEILIIKSINVSSLIVLMGELIRLGVFSYSKYLQRLAAKGLTVNQKVEDKQQPPIGIGPLHAKIMRSVPLPDMTTSLEHQRRLAIYGNRNKESWEEATHRRALKEVSTAFPWKEKRDRCDTIEWNAESKLRHFWSSSDFIRHRIIQSEVLPFLHQVSTLGSISDECFIQVINLLTQAGDFVSLCEIILFIEANRALCKPSLSKICQYAIEAHRLIWIVLNAPLVGHIRSISPHKQTGGSFEEKKVDIDEDLRRVFYQSVTCFLQGDRDQSRFMLINAISASTMPRDMLASAIFFAAFQATQQSVTDRSLGGVIIDWITLALSFLGDEAQQYVWTQSLVHSLELIFSSQEGLRGWQLLADMLLDLILMRIVSPVDLLRRWMIPRMMHKVDRGGATEAEGEYDCLLCLITSLFKTSDSKNDTYKELCFASMQASMIVTSTMDDIFSLLSMIAASEDLKRAHEVDEAITSICCNQAVQIYLQPRLLELCSFLGERLKRRHSEKVINRLLQVESLSSTNDLLDIGFAKLIEASTVWQAPVLLFQLSILIQRLESVDIGLQNRAQAKIQSIAPLILARWFKRSTIVDLGMPLLLECRSETFTTAIVEELLKKIHVLMKVTERGKIDTLFHWIQCTRHLLQSRDKSQLPPLAIATSIMSTLSEQVETANQNYNNDTKMKEEEEESQSHSLLDGQLAIVCLLLQMDTLWTSQSKIVAPQLAFTLLRQSIWQSSSLNPMANKILDVISYLFQEMPIDVLQGIQSSAEGVVDLIKEAMPEDCIRDRVLLLLNRTESNAQGGSFPIMILASTISNAYTCGKFVIDKPWEYHTNVEVLEYYHHQSNHQLETDEKQVKDDIDSTLMPLINNGPISLEHFNAKMSRDRIVTSRIKIDSEMSYGLGLGGEPMYARDIRRGLLQLENDVEVKKQNRSLARIKEMHMSHTLTTVSPDVKMIEKLTPLGSNPTTPTAKKRKKEEGESEAITKEAATTAKKKTRKR